MIEKYVITEAEFKEMFGLEDGYSISKNTLFTFTNQIKGAYLLYLEICDIDKAEFKNADDTQLSAYFDGRDLNFHPSMGRFQESVDSVSNTSPI